MTSPQVSLRDGAKVAIRASSPRTARSSPAGRGSAAPGRLPGFRAVDGDGPRFGAMIALVAVVVATVILVFFGIGYALGRLFL